MPTLPATACAYVELSINVLSCKVNNFVSVPVIALIFAPADCVTVNGLVGTVKLPVYTATPITNLTLVISACAVLPITKGLFGASKSQVCATEPMFVPFKYNLTLVPSNTPAT